MSAYISWSQVSRIELTQWTESGRNRIWRSPCVGDVGEAVLISTMFVNLKIFDVLTVHQLLTKMLKTLKIITRMIPLIFALNPTTTITQATNPSVLTMTLQMVHSPAKTNPTNRKIKRTRPASWTYIFLSFSSICGNPAGANFWRTHESERTMSRPPTTERLRRKKLRSKMRPYPRACVTTTPRRPQTAYSECFRNMIPVEQMVMAMTLTMRKTCVIYFGTVWLLALSMPYNLTLEPALTVSIIAEVEQLIVPLRNDS